MKPRARPKQKPAQQKILDDHRQIGELLGKIAGTGVATEIAASLDALLPVLIRHFQEEEDEIDGLHIDIQRRSPQQHQALLGLKSEHVQLLAAARDLLLQAKAAKGSSDKLQKLGVQLKERLATHESKETELFLDSIWTDIGEGD